MCFRTARDAQINARGHEDTCSTSTKKKNTTEQPPRHPQTWVQLQWSLEESKRRGQQEQRGELLPSQRHPAPLPQHCGAAQPSGATRDGQGNANTESHPESAGAAPHRKIQPLGYCLTSRREGKYLLSLNASRWLWDLSGMWILQNVAPGAFRLPEVKRGGERGGKKTHNNPLSIAA